MTGARADRCRLQAGSPATGILVLDWRYLRHYSKNISDIIGSNTNIMILTTHNPGAD